MTIGRRPLLTSAAGLMLLGKGAPAAVPDESLNILGPREGYSPQIGTLVSMMTWMRGGVLRAAEGLHKAQLDELFDKDANTIGALLLHLAATETYYQLNTFEGMEWGKFPAEAKRRWDAAMSLGDAGRKSIRGRDLAHYLDALREVREATLAGFRKRDDAWLMRVDEGWSWGPTNNFCKWFHVCEHESHHAGQISFLRKRLKSA